MIAKLRHILTAVMVTVALLAPGYGRAQLLSTDTASPQQMTQLADSVKQEYDLGPYFGLYKDNYFTVGTSIGYKPTAQNSDVKFQI